MIVYESNFNYQKIGKFVILALISAGLTIISIILINNLLKNIKNKSLFKLEKRKIEFKNKNNLYYFDPVYLVAIFLYDSGIKTQILSVSWYEFKNNPFSWMPGNDLGTVSIDKYLEGTLYENKQ